MHDYVPLGELEVGTVLHVQGGGEAILVSKTWRQGEFEVFDFEVEGLHNFYVRGSGSDAAGVLVHNSTKPKPYSNPKNRPKYADGQVDKVWESGKQADGKVYDPNTGEELTWDTSRSRAGQWDMGHKPGHEYRKLHKDYIDDKIDKDEFLKQYRDPDNYQCEGCSSNRGHQFEEP